MQTPFNAIVGLSNTLGTNLLNPPTVTGGVNSGAQNPYLLIRHIRIINKTSSAATVSMWKGATGANASGTEFAFQGTSVPANSFIDWYGYLELTPSDFLVGGSGTASALTANFEGEQGIRT